MSKKGKFDLTSLVQAGVVKEGENLYFVSDPSKAGAVARQPNGDYKLSIVEPGGSQADGETMSVHAAAQKFLGVEPPTHASQWWRNQGGTTLFQLWQAQLEN